MARGRHHAVCRGGVERGLRFDERLEKVFAKPRFSCVAAWLFGALSLSACGEVGTGQLNVHYNSDEASEAPSRVSLYLMRRDELPVPEEFRQYAGGWVEGRGCESLADDASNNAYRSQRNLPAAVDEYDPIEFNNLPTGCWAVVAVGYNASLPVARGCREVCVEDGQIAPVDIRMENEPVSFNGDYQGLIEFNFGQGLPGWLTTGLGALEAACIFDFGPQALCGIAQPLQTLLGGLRIGAVWKLRSDLDVAQGRLLINRINDIPVGTDWGLTDGSFSGYIPGASEIQVSSNFLRIPMQPFIQFLMGNVLNVQWTGALGPKLQEALGRFVGDLRFENDNSKIKATAADANGLARSINGNMNATIALPLLGTQTLPIDWTATRMVSSSTRRNP